mgnify:CR=1
MTKPKKVSKKSVKKAKNNVRKTRKTYAKS